MGRQVMDGILIALLALAVIVAAFLLAADHHNDWKDQQ